MPLKIKVVYSEKMVSDPGNQTHGYVASPSAQKPKELAYALKNKYVEFVEPEPVTVEDIKRCHHPDYVDGILGLTRKNGFGTISKSVVESLPYTNGSQYTAAKLAKPDSPTVALVAGFHHAGYNGWEQFGWFCTFNGLIIAANKLLQENHVKKVLILDCDMHYGNGTDDILIRLPELKESIKHLSFGFFFNNRSHAQQYLNWLEPNEKLHLVLQATKPDVILYQAGADVHVDDPYGGVLNTEQMYQRDLKVFSLAKKMNIPICWNLAGGYQVNDDGSINKVINLHLNTFKACQEIYETGKEN